MIPHSFFAFECHLNTVNQNTQEDFSLACFTIVAEEVSVSCGSKVYFRSPLNKQLSCQTLELQSHVLLLFIAFLQTNTMVHILRHRHGATASLQQTLLTELQTPTIKGDGRCQLETVYQSLGGYKALKTTIPISKLLNYILLLKYCLAKQFTVNLF